MKLKTALKKLHEGKFEVRSKAHNFLIPDPVFDILKSISEQTKLPMGRIIQVGILMVEEEIKREGGENNLA